eukprot:CAMPEP_0175850974 /NCGR_PEP_ID=MMETSP0107_2-20121207/25395_1 /TAXON_ID=195067 ORGANISM="Goniomonas pacifica, Strain CCMP1869" /NCGR_SAMPLE_ID=MMETSP0107_2 /ASSEMBLY_ACC=CAM_ASM_000203 /LENGTH=61 /DNA_ID=CAMNT_0017166337 /DNA_START=78 /DNA_END=262 /DNA_ORIENTATION=-
MTSGRVYENLNESLSSGGSPDSTKSDEERKASRWEARVEAPTQLEAEHLVKARVPETLSLK